MKASLKDRKLAVIERISAIQEPQELAETLDRVEDALAPTLKTKLSDWAYKELTDGMADTAAGRTHSIEEVDKLFAKALAKAKSVKSEAA